MLKAESKGQNEDSKRAPLTFVVTLSLHWALAVQQSLSLSAKITPFLALSLYMLAPQVLAAMQQVVDLHLQHPSLVHAPSAQAIF